MKVLVVNGNRERLPDPVYPLGAALVAEAARRAGHQVRTLDLCFAADPDAALGEALAAAADDVVAFSLRNVDSSTFPETRSYAGAYRAWVERVRRERPEARVVIGGAAVTAMPEALLSHLGADVAVVGEGQDAFPWLLERLEQAEFPQSDARFECRRWEGAWLLYGRGPGRPATEGAAARAFFDAARYYAEGGLLNIQTKRGCAYVCSYCSYPVIEGSRLRLREPAAVVDELEAAWREHGVRHWFFADSIFNAPVDHAKAICRAIIARRLRIEWTAYFNPRALDDELCGLLAEAGCRDLEFGTDSGSPRILESLGKGFGVDDLREAARLCRAHGLRQCQSLMFGAPGEDASSVRETIALMDELNPEAVIAMTGVRIMPGTALERRARREGVLAEGDSLLEPRFWFDADEETLALIEAKAAADARWIVPGLGVRQNAAVLRRLRSQGVKGQLWRFAGMGGA